MLDDIKKLVKEKKTIVGRVIKFPMADSYAYYIITKTTLKTATLVWFDYCDGWQNDRLGCSGNVDIDYAIKRVNGEDKLEEIFSKKKKTTV